MILAASAAATTTAVVIPRFKTRLKKVKSSFSPSFLSLNPPSFPPSLSLGATLSRRLTLKACARHLAAKQQIYESESQEKRCCTLPLSLPEFSLRMAFFCLFVLSLSCTVNPLRRSKREEKREWPLCAHSRPFRDFCELAPSHTSRRCRCSSPPPPS